MPPSSMYVREPPPKAVRSVNCSALTAPRSRNGWQWTSTTGRAGQARSCLDNLQIASRVPTGGLPDRNCAQLAALHREEVLERHVADRTGDDRVRSPARPAPPAASAAGTRVLPPSISSAVMCPMSPWNGGPGSIRLRIPSRPAASSPGQEERRLATVVARAVLDVPPLADAGNARHAGAVAVAPVGVRRCPRTRAAAACSC